MTASNRQKRESKKRGLTLGWGEPPSVGGRHYLLVGSGSSYLISSGQWEED